MPRLDHAAFESDDPDATAAFYERIFGARIVKAEGHPVMAYVGNTGFAFHGPSGAGDHIGVRVSDEERAEIKPP
jgi:catechol 2,3-dioxygenase-like lactoylglutathione lyase family enzyme